MKSTHYFGEASVQTATNIPDSDGTDNKELNKALVEAAGRAGLGMVVLQNVGGKEAAIVSVNDQACTISGYTEEESLHMTIQDVMPADVIADILSKYRDRQKGKPVPYFYETTIIRKDGTRLPITISLAITRYRGAVATVVFFRDVTEHKRVENELRKRSEALRLSSERQDALLSAIPDILMEVNNDKVYTWANKAGYEFFGEDVLGKEASYYFEGEQKTYDVVQPLFQGNKNVFYVESWQRRKDGKKRLLAWWCRVLKDEHGSVRGALSSARDITDRKLLEEEERKAKETLEKKHKELKDSQVALTIALSDLEKEKRKLSEEKAKDEAVLYSIGEGLFVVDLKGKIILINKAFEDILGWKQKEAEGKVFVDLVPAEDEEGNSVPPQKRPVMVTLATGKETPTFSTGDGYYLIKKDKTRFPIAYKVTLVRLDKKIIGAIGVFRDITKEKEIDRIKSEFLSVAAHQLRTPLGNMRWNVEMILGEQQAFSDPVRKAFQQMRENTLRMVTIVNELIDVSRMDQKSVLDHPKSTDVANIVSSVVSGLEALSKKRQVTARVSVGDVGTLYIDPKQFLQVLENLLANAIQYSRPKGVVVVTLNREDHTLLARIQDAGIGIPEKDQAKIFTKFFRAENAKQHDIDGTGLGLYVVKFYVERWGGKIWFESKEGKGTTFYLQIPTDTTKGVH